MTENMTVPAEIRDLAERAARTFVQTVLAVVLADVTGLTSIAVWRGAALAGLVSVLTIVHGALSAPTQSRPVG